MNERICITKTAATIEKLLGIEVHKDADRPIDEVVCTASEKFENKGCDRVFMYNPDAIGQWIYEKYREDFKKLDERADLRLDMLSVMPSVTPVCFGSMYSGMYPEKHGIQSYVKPVMKVETVFDSLPKEGKKAAIVSTEGDSISLIFLERNVDYFIYKTVKECNKKARELICEDEYDLIVLYNTNYDYWLHRNGPTGLLSVHALKENIRTYCQLYDIIKKKWKKHNTVLVFAPDHGCHRFFGVLGNHGKDIPEDMNIHHFYSFICANMKDR